MTRSAPISAIGFVLLVSCGTPPPANPPAEKTAVTDPLPSWNDGPSEQAITSFVSRVTKDGDLGYIPPAERIATFDNDGTLWSEQPLYFQFLYAFDRVRELAPTHPDWKTKEPFKAAIADDLKGALGSGEKGLVTLWNASGTGLTTEESNAAVSTWIAKARHPKTQRLYTEMVYQPMLELLTYLRANGFKTFIVSGGGIDFMRPWTERVYGIPPEQVIGTVLNSQYSDTNGKAAINIVPGLVLLDDGPGKPVGIYRGIGRRPVFAAGNSDGDREMLEYTTSGAGSRFAMIVHHTDAEREFAYDRDSPIGRLNKTLDQAQTARWTVVDMKQELFDDFQRGSITR
jgi:phosphoglycolate phosphatase-like HAD superfamily hydrolase